MRHVAPAWDEALNGGKESVACDLKAEPELARALLRARGHRARGLPSRRRRPARRRPGRRARARSSTARSPASATDGPHAARAGHDLNYLGWAGVLEDTAPGLPPLQPADLAAGALGAVVEVLAAAARARAHRPRRAADDLDDARLPPARLAPARRRSAAALPHRRPRLLPDLRDRRRPPAHGRRARAEVLRPALRGDRPARARGAAPRRREAQEELAAELAAIFADAAARGVAASSSTARTSASGRSRRSRRARRRSAAEPACRPLRSGEHTAAWRAELGFCLIAVGAGAAAAARRVVAGRRRGAARGLPKLVVSSRDGDLYVGDRAITTARDRHASRTGRPTGAGSSSSARSRGKRSTSLYVVRRDGGGLQRLTRGEQVVAMPAWRGDGRLLAYAASPLAGGSFDIWTVDRGGRQAAPVAAGGRPSRSRPRSERDGTVDLPHARAGRAVPGEDERLGHAAGRAARAPARLRPARAVPADDGRHEARLRLGDRQRRRRAGLGARHAARSPAGRCARSSSSGISDGSVRTYDGRGPPPLHALAVAHALAPARLPALRAAARSTASSSSATGRAASASPTTTGSPRGASPAFTRAAASSATAPRSNPRALSVEQGTSIGYTDLYPAHFHGQNLELRGVPAGIYVLVHRANPSCGSRRSTTRTTPPRSGSGSAGAAASPHVETLRAGARAQLTARARARPESEKRSGRRSGSSGRRPSRSSRNALIPSARAPSMSSS